MLPYLRTWYRHRKGTIVKKEPASLELIKDIVSSEVRTSRGYTTLARSNGTTCPGVSLDRHFKKANIVLNDSNSHLFRNLIYLKSARMYVKEDTTDRLTLLKCVGTEVCK